MNKLQTLYIPIGTGPDGVMPAYHVIHVFYTPVKCFPSKPPKGTFKTRYDNRHKIRTPIKTSRESNGINPITN